MTASRHRRSHPVRTGLSEPNVQRTLCGGTRLGSVHHRMQRLCPDIARATPGRPVVHELIDKLEAG